MAGIDMEKPLKKIHISKKITTYIDSPLEQGITATLVKIAELKQKYPSSKQDSAEKCHADKLVKMVETLLTTLHKSVLPKFDKQNPMPGSLGVVKAVLDLKKLRKELYTRKYALFQALSAELPAIIKGASQKHPDSITNTVLALLQQKKDSFFSSAQSIPGVSLDVLFDEIKHTIQELALDKHDLALLKDKKQVKLLLNKLDTILFKSLHDKYTFTIAHPMTFELAELMASLVNQAPKELAELAPFFNPESLEMDWQSGFKGPLNRTILGYSFTLEPQKNKKTKIPSYTYQFSHHAHGKLEEATYDGAAFYKEYSSALLTDFLLETNHYFTNFADTTHVKSERARIMLLQKLVMAESNAITDISIGHIAACKKSTNKEQLGTLKFIDALDKEFIQNQALLKTNKLLQEELTYKGSDYNSMNVATLLNKHSELALQFKSDASKSLNIKYSNDILPDEIIGFKSNTIQMMPIKNHLDELINEQKNLFQKIKRTLEKKILDYNENRQKAIAAWKQNILDSCVKNTEQQLLRLQDYTKAWSELNNATKESSCDSDNPDSLKKKIAAIEHQSQKRQQLITALTKLLNEIKNFTHMQPEDAEFDTGNELHYAKKEISTPAIEKVWSLIKLIESEQLVQDKKLYALQTQLEKIKLSTLFIETKPIAHSKAIKPLLDKTNQKIEKSQQEELVLNAKKTYLEANLSLKKRMLKNLNVHKNMIIVTLDELEKENQLIMNNFLKAAKNTLPNATNLPENGEELLNNPELLEVFFENLYNQNHGIEFNGIIQLFKQVFDYNFDKKFNLEAQLVSMKARAEKYTDSFSVMKEHYEKKSKESQDLAANTKKLQNDQYFLLTIGEIFEEIARINALVKSFANSEQKHYSDHSLFENIFKLYQAQSLLVTRVSTISQTIKPLENPGDYELKLLSIKELLNSLDENIVATVQLKLDLSPIQEQISSYATNCMTLQNECDLLMKGSSLTAYERIKHIKKLIADYNDVSNLISAQKTDLEQLALKKSLVNDKNFHDKMEVLARSQVALQKDATKLGSLLMDFLSTELLNHKQEANVFKENIPNIESTSFHKSNSLKLVALKQQLTNFPSDETLTKLTESVNFCSNTTIGTQKLHVIKNIQDEINAQISLSESINDDLLHRITERKILVDTLLIPKLIAYEKTRKKTYKIKDSFSATDAEMRMDFIKKLKIQLLEYKKSGDSTQVLKTIEESVKKFPGIKLQAILNKITIEIIEANLKTPADYLSVSITDENTTEDHDNASTVLKNLTTLHPKYVASINKLYRKIAAMRHYGAELTRNNDSCGAAATRLAEKLEHDVDRFVIAYPTDLPTAPVYAQFEENFITRLHSEDDVMSKHRKPWKQIIANVMIGLCSVGIALGVKLFYSKISDGRCTFFFNQTNRQEQIASLEESLHQVAAHQIAATAT